MIQKKLLIVSASAIISMMITIPRAVATPLAVPAAFSNQSAHGSVLVDDRQYRHCHNVGRFVRCYTADPWSHEHMKRDRLQGRMLHEGGPYDSVGTQSFK